ncbi:MAG TPA: hypothetical protein VNJ08_00410 [Bacteriovoracaceae bacterium]|nr:hypothetical protein [Bacteriovoracaceae bacterium]
MRPILKYLIGLWVVLLLAVGMLLYNAYAKLKPEIFIAVLSEQVQRNYPGTHLEVGKVDYRLSVDFNMGLKDLVLKRAGKVIGKLEEIELRLPWWLLLFQRGNAQINLSNLVIFIDDDKDEEANTDAHGDEATPSKPGSKRVSLSLPGYLANAQFTLRAKDIRVMDLGNNRRYFTLNKLLVRQFQFGKNSAFELNLPITMSHNKVVYKSELWLFGDLTPAKEEWDLKFRGEFRTSENIEKFQLEDLIIDGKAKFKPHELDVTSNLSFFIEKEAIGTGTFNASEKDFNVNLQLSGFPMSFLGLFEQEIKNPYFPGLTERAVGAIEIKKQYRKESIKLDGKLEFPGVFKLGASPDDVTGKWRINFNDAKWETSFISPKGEVSFFRRSVIDFKHGIVSQYIEELGFSEVDLSGAIQLVTPLEKVLHVDSRAYSSTTVSFKKCRLGEKLIDASFRYGISPDERFYTADINDNGNLMKLNFQQTGSQNKMDFTVKKFPWIQQYGFLAPYFSATSGILDGKLEGRWNDKILSGQWLSKLKATSLQLAGGEWILMMSNFWKNFKLDSNLIPDQNWDFTINKGIISVESLLLNGVDPAKMTGQIDTVFKKKSFLVLTYPKNKKWKPVRKEIAEPFWKRDLNNE